MRVMRHNAAVPNPDQQPERASLQLPGIRAALAYLAELGAGVLAVAYFLATLSRPSRMSLAPPAP